MFAVIFEVVPKESRWEDYLGYAKALKPELEKIEGFLDNERFESRSRKGRLLSLSLWRDEKAVIRWRTLEHHHKVQEKGRFEVFEDYHLQVGEVTADTDLPKGQRLAQQRLDETEIGAAKAVTISQWSSADANLRLPRNGEEGLVAHEVFESITSKGKLLLPASWRDGATAAGWHPAKVAGKAPRHLQVRIIRDYGMFDRREAPQYYPAVSRESS
ncbi:MAG TPA: antibiotic biosynthesis monooxygenase [Dongiaceae bacterium]|nr:antibiotic biosynthesis monooxygenase [Dongiaceae bacterium]